MTRRWLLWSAAALIASAVLAQIAGGVYQAAPAGLPDAGAITTWLATVTVALHTVLGIRVVGESVGLAFIHPSTASTVTHDGQRRLRALSPWSALWSGTATAAGVLSLAVVLGISATDVVRPGVLAAYAFDVPVARNYLLAGLCALAIAAIATIAVDLNWVLVAALLGIATVALPLLNSHAASLGDHSLAITSSLLHGVAITVWVGSLWSAFPLMRAGDAAATRRYERIAVATVAALLMSGAAAAFARMDSWSDLYNTSYGRLTSLKVALFAVAITCVFIIRRRGLANARRILGIELATLALTVGAGVALHGTAPSRAAVALPSAGEDLLGFAFPQPPTWSTMVLGWYPDFLLLTALAVALGLYVVGIRKVDRWPAMRTLSFAFGILLTAWASSGAIARYSMVSFEAHMVAHMVLAMLAPIFLVLGAPVTLALRALPATSADGSRSPRQWVSAVLHGGYARFLSNPLIVLALFTVGLYALYFTSAFDSLMSDHVGHTFMSVHFLITGLLFSYTVIGIDPWPRQLAYPLRLIMVIVAMAIHAFFAIALMQSTFPVGNRWYSQVRPPWIDNPLQDTYSGGGVAWALGEVPSLLLLIAVAYQWSRSESRLAARTDRQADRDGDAQLRAYNEHLARLSDSDD